MSIIKVAGEHRTVEWYPKTASTAFARNSVVKFSSGALVNSASTQVTGVILRDVVAADSDYATTGKVPVELALSDDIFEADVVTGTLTTTMVGTKVDTDAAYLGIDVTATTNKTWLIVGFISATKALVKLVGSQYNDNA